MELSQSSIKKLAGCDERLHLLFKEVAKLSPFEFIITHGHRSTEEQKKLYDQGRTTPGKIVTYLDGITKKSKHNFYPSQACDVGILIDGKLNWDEKNYIDFGEYVQKVALSMGIKVSWGGSWTKFKDLPHYEV